VVLPALSKSSALGFLLKFSEGRGAGRGNRTVPGEGIEQFELKAELNLDPYPCIIKLNQDHLFPST
jgi:hypothetical protein